MKPTVGAKLAAIVTLSMLLIISAGAAGIFNLRRLGGQTLDLAATTEASQEANQLNTAIAHLRLDLYDAISRRNPSYVHERAELRVQQIKTRAERLEQLLDEQDKEKLQRVIRPTITIIEEQVAGLMVYVDANDWEGATSRLDAEFAPIQEYLQGQIETLNTEVIADIGLTTETVEGTRAQSTLQLVLVTLGALLLLTAVTTLLWRNLVPPLRLLTGSASALAEGDLEARAAIAQRGDEIGALATSFNSMADRLAASHRELADKVAERTAELQAGHEELQRTLVELQTSSAEREALFQALQKLQNPIIPVMEGVLVAPIVGELSDERLQQLQVGLLQHTEAERARVVLLDVTGVPVLDPQAAQTLVETGYSLQLVGATPILVGIRPEVAESIVSAGVDLSQLLTAANLQHGVGIALELLGRSIEVQ